jgi:plasmid stabilization system protein ParE
VAKIYLSEEAANDLKRIGDYITRQLKSPTSARTTIRNIKARIYKLEDFPLIGTPLKSMTAATTDYRFLGCGSYLAFYRPVNGNVYIDRILHGRQDYISILLGDIYDDECLTEYPADYIE